MDQEFRPEQDLEQEMKQEMVLAPQVIQSIEILQKTRMDLRQMVQEELETNPALIEKEFQDEFDEDLSDSDRELMGKQATEDSNLDTDDEEASEADDEENLNEEELQEMLERHDPVPDQNSGGYNYEAADRKMEALYNTPGEDPGLRESLANDIRLTEADEKQKRIAIYLANNLDDDGFLQVDLEETRRKLNGLLYEMAEGLRRNGSEPVRPPRTPHEELPDSVGGMIDPEEIRERIENNLGPENNLYRPLQDVLGPFLISREDMEKALNLLQECSEAGIGARNEKECLKLQLDSKDDEHNLKKLLIDEHLEDVKQENIKTLASRLKIEEDRMYRLVKDIVGLTDKPGSSQTASTAREVTPDVVIEKRGGKWEVDMVDAYVPEITVSRKYRDLLRSDQLTNEEKDYLKEKVQSATHLKNSIHQRQLTIRNIAEVIAEKQEEFLEKGLNHLKPMKMQEVAEEVGCHTSTVSRASDGKYIQTPWKIMRMKDFFSGGTETSEGEEKSRLTVMNRIKTIIDREDKQNPCSDSEIRDRLEEQYDIDIARRTVAKYRKKMDIPSSRKRKSYDG